MGDISAELWQQPNGELIFCEIASPTGGGWISASIESCFHLNLDQERFYAECGITRPIYLLVLKPGGVKSGLFLAGYVVRGDSETTVRQNMEKTADWFSTHSRWKEET